ncbi:MAG: cytochrome c [Chloroflexi bacterium]|nr:MAG: cytochrome c [Chloroflexota bacterium]
MSSKYRLCLLCVILLFGGAGLMAWAMTNSTSSQPTLSAVPTASPTRASWLILPELPSTATQADVGAEIYRLVCQDCHGNRGQGLTDEWRAEWNPKHQNCWQSKCHAPNHPPEGFILPRYVPPLLGPGSLSRYETILELYTYIRVNMPWHNPGSLQEAEYWQVTAFLVRERQMNLGDVVLDEERAGKLLLSR